MVLVNDLNAPNFISFSYNMLNTRGYSSIIYTELVSSDTLRLHYFNRVAKFWDDLPNSVVRAFNTNNSKNQFNSEKVSIIANKFVRHIS